MALYALPVNESYFVSVMRTVSLRAGTVAGRDSAEPPLVLVRSNFLPALRYGRNDDLFGKLAIGLYTRWYRNSPLTITATHGTIRAQITEAFS